MRVSCRLRWLVGCAGVALASAAPARAADDVAAVQPEDAPAEESVENPFADLEPMPEEAPIPAAQPDMLHPQVNMAGFTREYRPVPIDATVADAAIRAALDRRIDGAWEFSETALDDVVRQLRGTLGVPVVLDGRALEDAGIDPDSHSVTARLSDMTVRAALRLILVPLDLSFVAADERLTVTTAEAAASHLLPVAYPLPRWAEINGDQGAERLIDLIQNTVAMETWDVVGGPGCIRLVEVAGESLLVINQTGSVHDAVERLLRALHGRALAEFAGGAAVLKIHPVAADRARADLEKRLKDLCNETLGAEADAAAEVTAVAATLAVRSSSPAFHALAAQVIAAVAGVERRPQRADAGVGNPFGQ